MCREDKLGLDPQTLRQCQCTHHELLRLVSEESIPHRSRIDGYGASGRAGNHYIIPCVLELVVWRGKLFDPEPGGMALEVV